MPQAGSEAACREQEGAGRSCEAAEESHGSCTAGGEQAGKQALGSVEAACLERCWPEATLCRKRGQAGEALLKVKSL